MKYLCAIKDLAISLVVSTVIIYGINIVAGFAGADYTFTSCLIPTKQTKTAKGSKENKRHVQ